MRTTFLPTRLALALFAASVFTACEKTEESPKGMSWSVDSRSATAAETGAFSRNSLLVVYGNRDAGNSYPGMILVMPKRTGSFDLSGNDAAASYLTSSTTSYDALSGTIKVTSYSATNVAGTYEFTGEPANGGGTKRVTSGKFNIDY